jgi:hypothetical protein
MRNRLLAIFALVVIALLAAPAAHAQYYPQQRGYTYMPQSMLDWQTETMDWVGQARQNMEIANERANYGYQGWGGNNSYSYDPGYGYGGGYGQQGYGYQQQGWGGNYNQNYGGRGYNRGNRGNGGYGYQGSGYGRGNYGGYGQRGGYRPFVRGHARATQDTVNAWGIANTAVGVGNLVLGFANRSKLNSIERKLDAQSYAEPPAEQPNYPQEPQARPETPSDIPVKDIQFWTNKTGCDMLVKDWDDQGWRIVKDGDAVRVEYGPKAECKVNRAGYTCDWHETGKPGRKFVYALKEK